MTAAPAPSVDVVITNHNYGRYLQEAIDSALEQTAPPARVVVVDDGSEDDSSEVIRAYGQRVVAVMKANGGQASAFNEGIDRSGGDVVMFLDADDRLRPTAVETVARGFSGRPDIARAHFRMEVIDAAGRARGVVKPHAHMTLPHGDLRRTTLTTPFDGPWMPTTGNAFAAWALRRLLPVPVEYRLCADWYLVHVSALYGPVLSIDSVLAEYRVHGRNGYERDGERIDLAHVRATIGYAARTRGHIARHAAALGLPYDERCVASMSDVGNRMISLRLSRPAERGADTRARLLRMGARACRLRQDTGPVFAAFFLVWLVAMAIVPRPLARHTAEVFLFPERRRRANRLLGRLAAR